MLLRGRHAGCNPTHGAAPRSATAGSRRARPGALPQARLVCQAGGVVGAAGQDLCIAGQVQLSLVAKHEHRALRGSGRTARPTVFGRAGSAGAAGTREGRQCRRHSPRAAARAAPGGGVRPPAARGCAKTGAGAAAAAAPLPHQRLLRLGERDGVGDGGHEGVVVGWHLVLQYRQRLVRAAVGACTLAADTVGRRPASRRARRRAQRAARRRWRLARCRRWPAGARTGAGAPFA